ncbi:MAG: hypothetical protein AAF974_01665 [Cyanobacteria bacterium P01_E01_bin.34]
MRVSGLEVSEREFDELEDTDGSGGTDGEMLELTLSGIIYKAFKRKAGGN